jgi:hypothetical protein
MRDHSSVMFGGAIIINATPQILRPLVGGVVRLLCSYYYKAALKRSLPIVSKRVELTEKARVGKASEVDLPVCKS